jgi:glucoamylase
LKVVDCVLKTDTPYGPSWHRYNYDGYGQRDDGAPYGGWGTGRLWPLLTGERGHYELAAGHDVKTFIEAMEMFASPTGLLPEQVWDSQGIPPAHMHLGKATGSAMPLMWAHAEYIKLLRSASDGAVFDLVPEVAERYIGSSIRTRKAIEIWKPIRQPASVKKSTILRVQAPESFVLHWSTDDWKSKDDTDSKKTIIGVEFVDIVAPVNSSSIKFTFYWNSRQVWEGKDYSVSVES